MIKPHVVAYPLLAVIFLAGCSDSGGGDSAARKELAVDDGTRVTVPLIPAYDPPVDLPQVELHHGSRPDPIQRGVRYAGEWIVAGRLERAPETVPIPWPDVTDLDADGEVFVSFGPVPVPDFIMVQAFGDEVATDWSSEPEPLAMRECAQTDPNTDHCIETRDGNVGMRFAIPEGGVRHVTAWASWTVPADLRERLGIESSDIYAAWLFKLHT